MLRPQPSAMFPQRRPQFSRRSMAWGVAPLLSLALSAALLSTSGCDGGPSALEPETAVEPEVSPEAQPEALPTPEPEAGLPVRTHLPGEPEPTPEAEPEGSPEAEPEAAPEPEPEGAEPEPEVSDDPALLCGATPAPSPIRRLTRREYNNVVRDLLGLDTQPASTFVPEEEALGFDNNAAALWVSQILAEQYMEGAEDVAGDATAQMQSLLPCDANDIGEAPCAEAFIESFGKRAYRRPLTMAEKTRLLDVFSTVRAYAGETFNSSVAAVIEAMMQSPHFLYRVEFGEGDPDLDGLTQVSDWEMASRLSFLIYNSMPDDELFAAAESGDLSSLADIEAQARRMLLDDKAQPALEAFHFQWLHLDGLKFAFKDETMFPDFNTATRDLLQDELALFLQSVYTGGDGTLADLLLSNTTYLNDDLADHYGVTLPQTVGDTFAEVTIDNNRAGVLTQGGLMSVLAKSNQTSPILRGVFVREKLLCESLPPPPDDVDLAAPDPDPNLTTRERFAQHTEDETCASCHVLIDPVGFGLEDRDAVGRYRVTENDQMIDASGNVLYSFGADSAFNGTVELSQMLAAERQVQDCYVKQWFRFGYGRSESSDDTCSMDYLETIFDESGGNLHELVVALTKTPAFRYRQFEEVQP